MLEIAGRKLLLGGVHDHWARADADNPAVLLAALNYYHYDFMTLMCGPKTEGPLQRLAACWTDHPKLYLGHEEAFGWAHVVTVNPKAPPLPSAETDIRAALRHLQQTCDLVVLAHPNYIAWESIMETGLIDSLLDEGLLDGIQFTADSIDKPDSREAKILDWYLKREAKGRTTPVVNGWDVHLMKAIKGIPPVLYSPEFIPDGHFEAACSSRTIVFCEENTLPAICAAIKAGESVVERLPDGRLYGPAPLVEFLSANGYRQAIAEKDRRRDTVSLRVDGLLKAGEVAKVSVSHDGTLQLASGLGTSTRVSAKANVPVDWRVPVLLPRDRSYVPVTWQNGDSLKRIWAVESEHPIQLDLLPLIDESGSRAVEVVTLRSFSGDVELEVEGASQPARRTIAGRTRFDLELPAGQRIASYRLTARDSRRNERVFEGNTTFFDVRRFAGDWGAIPMFGVDEPRFAPASAYGKGRVWPGPLEYSATLQFAWTPSALMLRATVTDEVHYQPFRGHYMYNADCLQLGIDPMLRRQQTLGNIYAFNLALTSAGPELYRTWSPDGEASPAFTPPKPDVSLGDRYLKVERWSHGLIYLMTLPWSEIAPVQATAGHRMGVYFIMFNNNGSGHLDTLHWPVPIFGMWTKPAQWGVLTLV